MDFGSTIFVGQAYLKYAPFSWLTLEGGKSPNPFVNTAMVWDGDINPEGFAEQFKTRIPGLEGGTPDITTAGYDKDGKGSKEVVTASEPGGVTIDLFGNFPGSSFTTPPPRRTSMVRPSPAGTIRGCSVTRWARGQTSPKAPICKSLRPTLL